MGFLVGGRDLGAPSGLSVRNYVDTPTLTRFVNAKRTTPVTEVILHETVTRSAADTVAVLKQRGLGVHLIVGPDGQVDQHADLLTDDMWHASQHNRGSVGIECVNPYDPAFLPRENSFWTTTISAPWCASAPNKERQRLYVVPTQAQAEAVCQTVGWLTSAAANPLTIPKFWPGLQHTQTLAFGRVPSDTTLNPGIHAHMYFGHADGAWLVLYCWLRLEAGFPPEDAYAKALDLATSCSSTGPNLSYYFQKNPFLQA